jgi:hypothetical protein
MLPATRDGVAALGIIESTSLWRHVDLDGRRVTRTTVKRINSKSLSGSNHYDDHRAADLSDAFQDRLAGWRIEVDVPQRILYTFSTVLRR